MICPNASSILHFVLFADDSNVFASKFNGSYDKLFQIMNTELPLINDWFKANRLSLNTNKTTFILFCSHRKFVPEPTPLILIENTSIPQSKSLKFLGVVLDQHLSWNAHIAQISAKVAKNIGILLCMSYKIPPQIGRA